MKISALGLEARVSVWKLWIGGCDFCFSFTVLLIRCVWLPAICVAVKRGQRLMSPFDSALLFQLWLACCRSMLAQCAGTIVLYRSCLSVSNTWMPARKYCHPPPDQDTHTYAGIRTDTGPGQTHVKTTTHTPTQSVLHPLPPAPHPPFLSTLHRCAEGPCFLFLIPFIKVRFGTLLFSIGWLLSMGSVKKKKQNNNLSIQDRFFQGRLRTGSVGVTTGIWTHSWLVPLCTNYQASLLCSFIFIDFVSAEGKTAKSGMLGTNETSAVFYRCFGICSVEQRTRNSICSLCLPFRDKKYINFTMILEQHTAPHTARLWHLAHFVKSWSFWCTAGPLTYS